MICDSANCAESIREGMHGALQLSFPSFPRPQPQASSITFVWVELHERPSDARPRI